MDRKTAFYLALPVAALLLSSCGKPMNLAGRTQTASSVVSLGGNLTVSSQKESSAVISAISSAISASSATGAGNSLSTEAENTTHTNGPGIISQPTMIEYQHCFYKIHANFIPKRNYYAQKTPAVPGTKLFTAVADHFRNSSDLLMTVYSVKGMDTAKCLCGYGGWQMEDDNYWRYDYLCPDVVSAGGQTFHMCGGNETIQETDQNTAGLQYTIDYNYFSSSPQVLKNIQNSLNGELGKTTFGAIVYRISDTEPSDAVYMNFDDGWFLIKRKGYDRISLRDTLTQSIF